MSLESIGLTSLFGLAWIIKFLWGPQVDEFATKRKWLLYTQGLLAVMILFTAFLAPLSWAIQGIAALFFLGSFVAATHDIAIDGYYMEALDIDGQAKFVGYRVMAYRIAMMTGTGVVVTIGTTISWFWAFLSAGMVMGSLCVFHLFFLPTCEKEQKSFMAFAISLLRWRFLVSAAAIALATLGLRKLTVSGWYVDLQKTYTLLKKLNFAGWVGILLFVALVSIVVFRKQIHGKIQQNEDSFYARAFLKYMDREKIGIILAFIILIRTGEFMLSAMASPFLVDLGIKIHYGWISAGVGLPCSIIGAMVGGALIGRYSLQKMVWPFLWAQNLTNIIYMFLALGLTDYLTINTANQDPVAIGAINLLSVALVHGFDQFAGGLGTAVLMIYLMRICLTDFKAAHYAIGTGLMSVSGLYAGIMSGFLASWLGYGYFFGISFLLSVPGMILVLYLPNLKAEP